MPLSLDASPEQVRLPGSIFSGTVATASDAQLADQLQASLDTIELLLEEWDAKPTAEGYAEPEWYERANASRPMHATESNVRRNERMARAIRKEQAARVAQAKAEREDQINEARQRLTEIVEHGPAEVKKGVAHAKEVMAATLRVRAFLTDLRLMGASTGLAAQLDTLRDGIAVAAETLDQPMPDLPDTPPGLPTSTEISEARALFNGREGFTPAFRSALGAGNADNLARRLKS